MSYIQNSEMTLLKKPPTKTLDLQWVRCTDYPLEIIIEGLPPTTINHTYGVGRNGRFFKKKKVSVWQDCLSRKINKLAELVWGISDVSRYLGRPLRLEIEYCRPSWRGKSGPKKGLYVRPDISNFIKGTEDAVMRGLGLDDSAVVQLIVMKIESTESTRIRLSFI